MPFPFQSNVSAATNPTVPRRAEVAELIYVRPIANFVRLAHTHAYTPVFTCININPNTHLQKENKNPAEST